MSKVYEVELSEEKGYCSLSELCQSQQLNSEFVTSCIEYGLTEITSQEPGDWQFSISSIVILQKAYRLHHDLGVNVSAIGLVLELLNDNKTMASQIKGLEARLENWEKL